VVPLMQVPKRGVTAAFRAEEMSAGRKRSHARTPLVRNDGEVFFADANRRRSSGAEVKLQKNGCNLAMIE
jgi:hypothetical protein